MGTQRNLLKSGVVVMLVGLLWICLGGGCSQKSSRVYKITYSAHRHQNLDVAATQTPQNPNDPQSPNNQSEKTNSMSLTSGGTSFTQEARIQNVTDPLYPVAARPMPRVNHSYHIGPGDLLQIKVFQLTELEKEAVLVQPVDRRGQIYLPLLNHVQAAGLTCSQLQSELILRLGKEFIRDPRVDVSIKEYGSKQVIVLGAVRRPGPVTLRKDCASLIDVISEAGGIQVDAAPDIEILRGAYRQSESNAPMLTHVAWQPQEETVRHQRERVSVQRLYGNPDERINPIVYPGDVVQVPPGADGVIYVSGEVKQPGTKTFRRPLNILQMIASAGNITNIADEKKCKILRRTPDGQEKVIDINLKDIRNGEQPNILLAQNDTVIIPADPVKKFFDDLDKMIRRGVILGVDATYDAGVDMGFPQRGGY